MKINWQHKATWKILSLLSLAMMFFIYNQCVITQLDEKPTSVAIIGDEENVEVDSTNDHFAPVDLAGATEVARSVTSVGVKDFEQIYRTMEILTGVEGANEFSVRSLFGQLSTLLPTDTSVKSYLSSHQVAVIKLGAQFCEVLFNRSQYYDNFFTSFNIRGRANEVLTPQGKEVMISEFIDRFWGVDVQTQQVEVRAMTEMNNLVDDLLAGEDMNSSNTTRLVAKGVCISLISSAPVVLQ